MENRISQHSSARLILVRFADFNVGIKNDFDGERVLALFMFAFDHNFFAHMCGSGVYAATSVA
jgi:hypothetical protein